NNPIHQKFVNELIEKVDAHLKDFGSFRLRVQQFQLLCSGQPVYENPDRLESIAFRLFVDGVRELSFLPGITKEEMIAFLEVLGREEDSQAVDDDIVTLLWEKQFAHIQYYVVDDLRGEIEVEECREMRVSPVTPQQLHALREKEVSPEPPQLTVPRGVEIASLDTFKLTEEEVGKLQEQIRREKALDMIGEMEGILFDIVRIEREPVVFSEILGMMDNILESLMLRGDFRHARRIVEFYREMTEASKDLPEPLLAEIQNGLLQACHPNRLLMLEPILDGSDKGTLEDFTSLMVLLGNEALPSLIDLLGKTGQMKTRRFLCDLLVEVGKTDVEYLAARLNDERWYLTRNLVYVLGKIGDPRIVEALSRCIRHSHVQVRKAVFLALNTMEDRCAEPLLVHFISDADDSNRISAIKSLGRRKVKEALSSLLEILSAKDFETKGLSEKEAIFEAVGQIGGDRAIPHLQRFLAGKWTLFRDAKVEETAGCAAAALQKIGSPSAMEALREGSRSKNKGIREACSQAIEASRTAAPAASRAAKE
ncbi:MAG: HEAT repeat domain-containing protein, partial [Candidatus Binatia bacterium]